MCISTEIFIEVTSYLVFVKNKSIIQTILHSKTVVNWTTDNILAKDVEGNPTANIRRGDHLAD